MPYSYTYFDKFVQGFVYGRYDPAAKILDIGPGKGKYHKLLSPRGYHLDAVEVHAPYIEQFKLKRKYKSVVCGDIRSLVSGDKGYAPLSIDISQYALAVMGDVLEHISFGESLKLLNYFKYNSVDVIVVVPYEHEQGEMFGNVHETHLQPDLTKKNMLTRYPSLTELISNKKCGVYIFK